MEGEGGRGEGRVTYMESVIIANRHVSVCLGGWGWGVVRRGVGGVYGINSHC